jgi:methylmalonyl-CoA/ethylmalonyl-CoA epimerase
MAMEKTAPAHKLFSRLEHVGAIVADVDKAAAEYQSLGMGLFEPLITERLRWVRGKLVEDYKIKIKIANLGPIKLELIEPVSGKESVHKEFLENTGGGIHHLAYAVDDIDEAEREMINLGYELIFKSRSKDGGGGGCYFKSDRPDAIIFEFVSRPRR